MSGRPLEWLIDVFRGNGDRIFLVWKDQPFSYKWLLDRMSYWGTRIYDAGIRPGTVVSIEGDYSGDTIALFFALADHGAILVPLTSGAAAHHEEFREIAEVQFIATSDEVCAQIVRRQAKELENTLLTQLAETGDPGLVLFSSGSTGKSKAVLHKLTLLLRKFQTRRHSLVSLAFLMLDHIGGINTLLYVLSNAGTLVGVEHRDPDVVCAAIARHGVELLPTSPTFLNLVLLSEAYKRHDLSSLKRITYGTEVMPERTLERIRVILPQVELQQTYGLSEIGILRSKSQSSDSLWLKVGGEEFETKVHEGTLWVKARSAMFGYLNAPSPFDSNGWFNTGDAVEINGDYIRILGRQSELINVGGEKVYPVEVENVLLGIRNVSDVVVTGEPNPITGHVVVARFTVQQPEDPVSFRKRVRDHCRGKLAPYKVPVRIEIVAGSQHNSRYKKIRRATN